MRIRARFTFFALLFVAMAATLQFGAVKAEAGQASLSWAAPTTNTDGTPVKNLAGYNVYVGSASHSYQQKINAGNLTSYQVSNLTDGSTYYFAVTAYDTSGNESAYSNEGVKTLAALPVTHTITATSGAGGTVTALNNPNVNVATSGSSTITTVKVTDGANQSFAIAAASGYKVSNVTVDGTSVGAVTSYTFTSVKADHTISATFATSGYSIAATAGTGGAISPSGTATVAAGGSQTYTITPASGYGISSVAVDGASVGAVSTYTFSNVQANHTISATFAATASYTISASTTTGGTISPAGTATVTSGGSKSYTITPATGYKISYVLVDGVSVGVVSSYTFNNVQASHTIQAGFYAWAANNGGTQYVAKSGVTYVADGNYSGGTAASDTSYSVAGTIDPSIYQSWRYGSSFSYSVPVPNGSYNVTLKFCENKVTAAGQRVFNVAMQGTTVISNLDIYAKVGQNKAYDVTVPVSVTNGTLKVSFTRTSTSANDAKVNGIFIAAK